MYKVSSIVNVFAKSVTFLWEYVLVLILIWCKFFEKLYKSLF